MPENISKSRFRLNMKIFLLRTWKLSKNELDDIVDIFFDYLNVIEGLFSFSWIRVTQNLHLA